MHVMRTVGTSEMGVSNRADDVLVTYSLGSCIGLALHDPVAGVGGLIHCMLPVSEIDPAKAASNPQMFTDTGVPALIEAVLDLGAQKSRLVAKVAGAASFLAMQESFQIGERNYVVLRKILWEQGVEVAAEDTGGTVARSMYLYMASGKTTVKVQGVEKELG